MHVLSTQLRPQTGERGLCDVGSLAHVTFVVFFSDKIMDLRVLDGLNPALRFVAVLLLYPTCHEFWIGFKTKTWVLVDGP